MIEIRNLRKEYENVTPLKSVSTTINNGDVIAVIGPSGTGKSTLLRCLNLLEKPTSGQIFVDGEEITSDKCDISRIRQKMGMVFQSFNLFGHQTVIENIMYAPMKLLSWDKQKAYDRGMELLRTVGLAEKALNYPSELSGGQKQRVAIARTLAMDPETILFDEPTSALDPTMVGEVQAVIKDLSSSGKTLMIVTHEMEFARQISNRVFYMDEGGIYEDGTPEQIFEHPEKEKTRQFIRRLKVLRISIKSRDYDFVDVDNEIENYCYKNRISHDRSLRIHTVHEELCRNILIQMNDQPEITMTIEYSEKTDQTDITVRYTGEAFDPEKTEDQLAYRILAGRTSEILFESGEDGGKNTIRIKIK